jgi:hypothetical protein
MCAWTAAQADMSGTVRPLGGYQVTPRYQELARRLGIEGTVLPNAGGEPRPMAGARDERRLLGVGSSAWFGGLTRARRGMVFFPGSHP